MVHASEEFPPPPPLSEAAQQQADQWYDYVDAHAPAPWLRPEMVDARNQVGFAIATRKLVVRELLHTHLGYKPLPGVEVDAELGEYYRQFDPTSPDPDLREERIEYQDRIIPYALEWREGYAEIDALHALRAALIRREGPGHQHASRAIHGMIAAMGQYLWDEQLKVTQSGEEQ